MKKILLSLGTLVVVGAIVVGATIAFYNDTETSTGNIFVAGSIDLKVDHTLATYNGVGSMAIVSDTQTQVNSHNAVPVTSHYYDSSWTASVPGAIWIWEEDPENDPVENEEVWTFTRTFNWTGGPISNATLQVASDNSFSMDLNGTFSATAPGNHFAAGTEMTYTGVPVVSAIVPGLNTLTFVVTNESFPGGPANPGGLMFRLDIEGQETWVSPVDLTDEQFFNFDDVKPGDYGTNVISLHVDDNDAYACLIVNNKDDEENSLLNPETDAGDSLILGNPTGLGELSDYLNVFTWGDINADGVYNTGETSLGSGPLSTLSSIMSMDSTNSEFLTSTDTEYIGLAWCAGTLTPNLDSAFGCDGNGMGNIAQSDSFTADLTAYAEQVRNNSTFTCAGVDLPPYAPI